MFIKRILALLIVLVAGYGVAAAQESQPTVTGEWEIVKIETRLLSQQDNKVLEEKTITKQIEFKDVTGFVPVKIEVNGENCRITNASGFVETGKYRLGGKDVLLYQKAEMHSPQSAVPGQPPLEAPYLPYKYKMQNGGILVIELPRSSFMDTGRNLPVVQECTGYYKKKQ
ncbi:hypothetical protein [Chitinophaga filiformis]|uniref:Lipocalin-like domain-containing protein n=1 Tax=Chitinophaga filiformis TaxID=104663 RepID=A0A1G7LID0_CHIFI|nr:hypothetical protein [Chitinophaga filiformis]SDF49287.1 hypothetical protein SAMN04488121_10278 [Chitinophaga filiformis]